MDILLLVALGGLLIFFMFNSRKKQKDRMQKISDSLVPGATVMTSFGIYGTVLSVDQENLEVTIESGPGTILRVHRQAIGQVTNPEVAGGTVPDASSATDATADDGADADDSGRITDAELDAMNQAKRADRDSADGSPADEKDSGSSPADDEDDSRLSALDADDASDAVDATNADDSSDADDASDADAGDAGDSDGPASGTPKN